MSRSTKRLGKFEILEQLGVGSLLEPQEGQTISRRGLPSRAIELWQCGH
jgi:hypothetical protein